MGCKDTRLPPSGTKRPEALCAYCGAHATQIDCDGYEQPTAKAFEQSWAIMYWLGVTGRPLPTAGIIRDGEGGLAMEYRDDPVYEGIEIDRDGEAICVSFLDCKLKGKCTMAKVEESFWRPEKKE